MPVPAILYVCNYSFRYIISQHSRFSLELSDVRVHRSELGKRDEENVETALVSIVSIISHFHHSIHYEAI
jgi:hypothetical protein